MLFIYMQHIDKVVRTAHPDSTWSSHDTSSFGIPDDLFKSSISPERLCFDPLNTTSSSHDIDVGIDSLQVERGTAEDSSMAIHLPVLGLTSPTRRASQFFKFLSEATDSQTLGGLSDLLPSAIEPSSPIGSHAIQTTALSTVDDKTNHTTKIPVLFVRDGPKENFAQVSPAPRRRVQASHSTSRPTYTPTQTPAKAVRPKPSPLGHRMPLDELRNADESSIMPRNVSNRSVSVASSVRPYIEKQATGGDTDPYTPIPSRRTSEGRREHHSMVRENIPPNAPARPVRGQARKYSSRESKPQRRKETTHSISPSKSVLNEPNIITSGSRGVLGIPKNFYAC